MYALDTTAPWAILPDQLRRIDALAAEHMKTADAGVQAAMQSKKGMAGTGMKIVDSVAVIELTGPLTKELSWATLLMGGTSMQEIGAQLRGAIEDPQVKGILLRIDSPGGSVDGTDTLAQRIRAAGAQKAVIALASGTMASAAYWAGSAASAVYLESSTTAMGSIGIVAAHRDISGLESRVGVKTTEISAGKFKRIASAHEPLSEAGRNTIQAQLDQLYSLFLGAVAQNRNATIDAVQNRMADGRIFIGQAAIDAGLADGFASEDELIARLSRGTAKTRTFQPSQPNTTRPTMNTQEIHAEAFNQVGAGGSAAQYQAAINGITASNKAPEPRCERTGLTADEKLVKADAYAKENGVTLVQALKALDYAR